MVFLGILFSRDDEKIIKEKSRNGNIQNQVNTFQWNCIDGFYENLQKGIRIINVLPVGIFPFQYKDLILRSKQWTYNNELHDQVGGVNVPFFKQFFRYKKIKKILKNSQDKEICIYSMYLPFLRAIQKLDASYHVKLIVPDLPEYSDYSKQANPIRKFFQKQNTKKLYKNLRRVDSFVLLTEYMKEPLKVGDRPYVVVEGIGCCDKKQDAKYDIMLDEDKKIILYTGSLHQRFGVDVLVKAFSLIPKDNYELWLCGGGDYVEEIKRFAIQDSRIKFFGYVSKLEAIKKQQQATVLVNPRQNNELYTKYSFPSKTMEYLASGIPVIAYKLDGIPNEYDEYINYVADNSLEELSKTLQYFCEMPKEQRWAIGEKAQRFIFENKNPKIQTKKIIDLV